MVEFALLTPLFLFTAITFIMTALAASQHAYSEARCALLDSRLSTLQLLSYIESGALGSSTIIGGGANLAVTVPQAAASGQPVTVTVMYNLANDTFMSSMANLFSAPEMGTVLPASLSATESMAGG